MTNLSRGPHIKKSFKRLTRCSSLPSRSTSPPQLSLPHPWTRPSQRSPLKINLRWPQCHGEEGEVEGTGEAEEEEIEAVGVARPDPPQAEVTMPTSPIQIAGIRVKDTPPRPQKPAVNAIMSMGTKLTTVWSRPPAPGLTSAFREIEELTNLTGIKKIFITTRCFLALAP